MRILGCGRRRFDAGGVGCRFHDPGQFCQNGGHRIASAGRSDCWPTRDTPDFSKILEPPSTLEHPARCHVRGCRPGVDTFGVMTWLRDHPGRSWVAASAWCSFPRSGVSAWCAMSFPRSGVPSRFHVRGVIVFTFGGAVSFLRSGVAHHRPQAGADAHHRPQAGADAHHRPQAGADAHHRPQAGADAHHRPQAGADEIGGVVSIPRPLRIERPTAYPWPRTCQPYKYASQSANAPTWPWLDTVTQNSLPWSAIHAPPA